MICRRLCTLLGKTFRLFIFLYKYWDFCVIGLRRLERDVCKVFNRFACLEKSICQTRIHVIQEVLHRVDIGIVRTSKKCSSISTNNDKILLANNLWGRGVDQFLISPYGLKKKNYKCPFPPFVKLYLTTWRTTVIYWFRLNFFVIKFSLVTLYNTKGDW